MSAFGWLLIVIGVLLLVSVVNQSYGPAWEALKGGLGS